MNKERKLIIAGNWKMNKTAAEALALVSNLKLELANIRRWTSSSAAIHGAGIGVEGHLTRPPARRAKT